MKSTFSQLWLGLMMAVLARGGAAALSPREERGADGPGHGGLATPAEALKVPAGFKVELLYAPDREREGSWVSLCADGKGHLFASGQYDEGLFRITLTPAVTGKVATAKVEKLHVQLSGAQGLCWAFNSLYALVSKNGKTPSGLYRVSDSDGDDELDKVQLLQALEGGGDHGWHAILAGPDGKSLYAIAGNNTRPPELAGARVPPHWSEDHLLPSMPDAGGHMKGVLAPGGVIYRVSPDGKKWEMMANGFRNPYDAAFNHAGELFTWDADMEWDMGTPWYRPTRICHATSGAEFGWRNGTGKWPDYLADSLPGILDVGPGSPTGVTFGYGSKFPTRYQEALFAADWTFGRIYAVRLRAEGSSYRGEKEVFVSGVPLPVTDMIVDPNDGGFYFITGGWRIQSGLYRVTWTGATPEEPVETDPGASLRVARRKLEEMHGKQEPGSVEKAWAYLGHPDRFLSFAARVALEWQDQANWRERALAETEPSTALNALMALVRVNGRDELHRRPADTAPEPGLQRRVLAALDRLDWNGLSREQRLALVRAYALSFIRLGAPDDVARTRLLARFEPRFPTGDRALNSELCQLLVYLQSTRVAAAALALVRRAPTQEEQLDYVKSLRMLRTGWTPESRKEYFGWFSRAAGYRGGASFAGFVKTIKGDALALVPEAERAALRQKKSRDVTGLDTAGYSSVLAGRTNSRKWSMTELLPALGSGLTGRDLERGRRMFGATGCFQCHRFLGEGGAAGPDLTQVAGRFSPGEMLEAILEPSKTVSDLYGNSIIKRRNGENIVGRIVYLHGDSVMVGPDMFNPAETVRVDRKEVISIEPSGVSPMPEGLLTLLTREEILDLLAYLSSGRGERPTAGGQELNEPGSAATQ